MLKINRSYIPKNKSTSGGLDTFYPFRDTKLKSINEHTLLKFELCGVDIEALTKSVYDAMTKFGQYNYRLGRDENQLRIDKGYGGFGLTYNPELIEEVQSDIHEQVQGNPQSIKMVVEGKVNPFTQLPRKSESVFNLKNTHYDTYGMSYRTPASQHDYLGKFLDATKRTMVRSAVRIIYADEEGPVDGKPGVHWHTDESMTENLRVNIPLVTDPIFVLEQKDRDPVHLEKGHAYSWDTNILHRAYATEKQPIHRIHLMLGFSCWWDFNEATGDWEANEFFGKKHPKDMLVDGDVIPGLKLVN
jgi:hypothetical protein